MKQITLRTTFYIYNYNPLLNIWNIFLMIEDDCILGGIFGLHEFNGRYQ